jgi:hypothetical protein
MEMTLLRVLTEKIAFYQELTQPILRCRVEGRLGCEIDYFNAYKVNLFG